MAILTKWKKGRLGRRDLSSKMLPASRAMARPNRRESIEGDRPLPVVDIAVWTILFGVSGYLLLFSPFLSINQVEISGLGKADEASVHATVSEALSGKRFFIWPKENFFAVRPSGLAADLAVRYPIFREVSVTRRFPQTLLIEAKERERIVLWRSGNTGELIVGEDGRLFQNSRVADEENAPYRVSITDLSAQSAVAGERIADERLVPFVSAIGEAISGRFGMTVGSEYAVASRSSGELRMTTSEGWELYVSTELPIATTLDTLALLFDKELPAEKRATLRYVDLRIENRVYYTFKDASGEVVSTETQPILSETASGAEKKKKK